MYSIYIMVMNSGPQVCAWVQINYVKNKLKSMDDH